MVWFLLLTESGRRKKAPLRDKWITTGGVLYSVSSKYLSGARIFPASKMIFEENKHTEF